MTTQKPFKISVHINCITGLFCWLTKSYHQASIFSGLYVVIYGPQGGAKHATGCTGVFNKIL
jgi:hypothetical protein